MTHDEFLDLVQRMRVEAIGRRIYAGAVGSAEELRHETDLERRVDAALRAYRLGRFHEHTETPQCPTSRTLTPPAS